MINSHKGEDKKKTGKRFQILMDSVCKVIKKWQLPGPVGACRTAGGASQKHCLQKSTQTSLTYFGNQSFQRDSGHNEEKHVWKTKRTAKGRMNSISAYAGKLKANSVCKLTVNLSIIKNQFVGLTRTVCSSWFRNLSKLNTKTFIWKNIRKFLENCKTIDWLPGTLQGAQTVQQALFLFCFYIYIFFLIIEKKICLKCVV